MDLPRLRRDQMRIAADPAKVKILSMGRRWGKTILGGVLVALTLQQHGRVAWIAPTYKNTRALWRWLLQALADDIAQKRISVNQADRTIETRRNGFMALFSGDNIDSIRGEAFHLVVIDEAAKLPETAWTDAIMPTLADFNGDAVLISTPRGRNWFWSEWQRGQSGDPLQRSWSAPTGDNPMPTIRSAVEKARTRVPERTFRQEWLAEFVDDSGGVFRRVAAAATATPIDAAAPGGNYIIGVDWAKTADFTVFAVLDADSRELVHLDRFNQIDYAIQVARLRVLAERFAPIAIIAERNNIGEPLIEQLQRDGLPVQPFTTTNASKMRIIDALALAFERQEIRILPDPVLLGELQVFEMQRLPSGLLRYSAPSGLHDDTVMALALAWHGVASAQPLLLW